MCLERCPRSQTILLPFLTTLQTSLPNATLINLMEQDLEQTTRRAYRRTSTAQGLQEDANGVGERRKTTETDTRSSLSTLYACTRRFPPKFVLPRVPTNQIIGYRRVHALAARVTGMLLRVYKARPVAVKSFGLGLARVRSK